MSIPPRNSAFTASISTARPAGHKPQLDGLRALAVGSVLLCHTLSGLPFRFEFGAAGVRLFFVLSGFLITGILLRARAEAEAANVGRGHILLAFYARRFLRIFPLYYAVLLLAAALDLPGVRATSGWHLTYLSNYFVFAHHDLTTPYLNHLWSLSVEEQFYLVWPLVILFTPFRRLLVLVLIAMGLAPFSRVLFGTICPSPYPHHGGAVITLSCLDTLGAGALLALLWESGSAAEVLRARARRWSLTLGGILLVATVALIVMKLDWRMSLACKHLAYSLIFLAVVDRAAEGFGGIGRRILEARPMVYLGSISYGIYMYHEFVPALVKVVEKQFAIDLHFPESEGIARFLCVTIVTIGVAALSWHAFEKPLNNLKSRFPYVSKKARSVPTVEMRTARSSAAA